MSSSRNRSSNEVSRRTWIEWIGQATVFSLSAYVLGCSADAAVGGARRGTGGGGSAGGSGGASGSAGSGGAAGKDAGPDGSGVIDAGPTPTCGNGVQPPFQFSPPPNSGELFDAWPVRTVDNHEVNDILSRWRLRVDGMVESPREMSFYEMLCLARQDQVVDFHCVEGWSVYDVPWNGVHLSTLVALAKPLSSATHITFHTIGGKYNESLPLDVALESKTLLAYGINGSSLPVVRGFPARLVVPRLFAYKSAKFVERIEFTDEPVEGYWVAAGYSYDAEVQPSRLRPGKY